MHFFTILYIKTNRFSDEKIAVGLLANLDNVPYFGYSNYKVGIALKSISSDLTRAIKRSLSLLEKDVNMIIKGETSLSLFDKPYAEKLLKKLTLKKRGVLIYSDLIELKSPIAFNRLYKKYIGELWSFDTPSKPKNIGFKNTFHQFTLDKKFNDFSRKKVLSPDEYSMIYSPIKVDLWRKTNYYTVFHAIDFQKSLSGIQSTLVQFKLIVEGLMEDSRLNGMSKGRYYLVYQNPKHPKVLEIIQRIKKDNFNFELIKLSEVKDKV